MRTATQRANAGDLIQFRIPAENDRETRDELRAILRTHVALQSTTTLRRVFVHILAVLGGLFIGGVLSPDITSQTVRNTLLWSWELCCLAAVTSAAVEWSLRKDQARLLARNLSCERPSADDRP